MPAPGPSFYQTELRRALAESAFGVASYDVLPPAAALDVSSESQAIARVKLLENVTVYLRLSIAGYQVIPNPEDAANPGSPQLEIVESLDTMLRVLSPAYATKHTDLLVQRLRQESLRR